MLDCSLRILGRLNGCLAWCITMPLGRSKSTCLLIGQVSVDVDRVGPVFIEHDLHDEGAPLLWLLAMLLAREFSPAAQASTSARSVHACQLPRGCPLPLLGHTCMQRL